MEQAVQTKDYRGVLVQELARRVGQNPAYSLRRFAQQLDISPATLSGVLAGKRRLSLKAALQIAEKLGMEPAEAKHFYQSVATGLVPEGLRPAEHPSLEYLELSQDVFEVVSDWYHYAILELTFVKGCRSDARWIARKLGIHPSQATDAIARLKRLGLLETRNGSLVKTHARIASSSGVPSVAIRKRHKQILEKATASLETHSVDERDFSAMTMAIDPALLPEAKKRIAAFRRELCEFLDSGNRREVYEMSIQLFPLTKGEGK